MMASGSSRYPTASRSSLAEATPGHVPALGMEHCASGLSAKEMAVSDESVAVSEDAAVLVRV
jgi:hypothetical protein